MRQIYFRAKHDDKWVYGDLEVQRCDGRTLIHCYDESGKYHRQYDVSSDTVGQFTGKLDKNGTPIYEGDIVKTALYDTQVIYEDCGFRLKVMNNKLIRSLFLRGELEVIGNIYDNKQLV